MELLITLVLLPLGVSLYNSYQLGAVFQITSEDSEESRFHKVYHTLSGLRAKILKEDEQIERNRRGNNTKGVTCHLTRKEKLCRELLANQALAERNSLVYYSQEEER